MPSPPGRMQEEPYTRSASPPRDMDESPVRGRALFSCSPRDFRLPVAMNTDEIPHRRSGSRRAVVPRDKNKMRVSEMLHGERYPTEFEVASEARLQRHLTGTTDRRRREWSSLSHDALRTPWERPAHEARVASLLGTMRGSPYEIPAAPRDPGAEVDEDLEDWLPSTPLALETTYSSDETERIDEDPRSSPLDAPEDLVYGAASISMHSKPVPVPGASASPQIGTKRKHDGDDSPGWARRRGPMLLAGRRGGSRTPNALSTSPRSTSPRRVPLLHGQGALISPSSSPLAIGEARRRASTPNTPALAFTACDAAAGPGSRPSSPNTWRLHARSPSHSGSGPGYGSGAIGLRLGAHTPWDGVSLSSWLGGQAEGREVDEGVRCLGLG